MPAILIEVGYSFNGCSGMQTNQNLNLDTTVHLICIPAPCPSGIPAFRSFAYANNALGSPSTSVNGLFVSRTQAEGAVAFRDFLGRGSALSVGWTASK